MPDESAAELVERLTAEGFASLRDDVAHGRRETGLKALDERGAMSEIIRDQYTGRYPLELIQNANDAEASEGSTGRQVKFVVTESALLVADQGAGFGVDQVQAICGLARTSKDPRKNIGYKGLGFKSVREITDRPQIVSAGVRFGFDAERLRREIEAIAGDLPDGQRLPDYAFPFTLADEDLADDLEAVEHLVGEGFRTVLRLPFREPGLRDVVAEHVARVVTPRLLLFLDATESLEVVGTDRDCLVQAIRETKADHEFLVLQADGEPEEYLIFRREVAIIDRSLVEGLGRAWRDVEAVRVVAAVPLGPDGPRGKVPEPIYVYFPTEEETGFSVALHADFQMDLDRRRISKSMHAAAYNQWLRGALVEFVADEVVPWLASHYPGTGVLETLARHATPSGEGASLRWDLFQQLRGAEWLPCTDGRLHGPADALLLPQSAPDPAVLHAWLGGDRPFVEAGAEESEPIRAMLSGELGVREAGVDTVMAELEPPASDGAEDFYGFLVEWAQRQGSFTWYLKQARCVRLRNGTWVRPTDPAFLPRQRSEADFPAELNIPIVDVPEVDGLNDLLESAGVKPLSWRTVVTDFLMPVLGDARSSETTIAPALAALRTYFDSMRGGTGDQDIWQAVQGVLLPARRASETELSGHVRKSSELYFGRDWLPDSELETIYGPFEGRDFLCAPTPADDDDLQASRSFYAWLGVADRPRVVVNRNPYSCPAEWRESLAYCSASDDPQRHPASQVLSDPQIDRIHTLVSVADRSRLVALWRELTKHWIEYSSEIAHATWRCVAGVHKGTRDRTLPSSTAFTLRHAECVPVLLDGQPKLARAESIWRPTSDTPAQVRGFLNIADPALGQVTAAMAEWLGFVDGARPTSADVVGLLQELERACSGQDELTHEDVDAAHWLMRKLDRTWMSGDAVPNGEDVPLLAEQDGVLKLIHRPYLASDPLLAATWSDTAPIYQGDRDLHALLEGLEVPTLDEEVQVTPLAGDVDPAAVDLVWERLAEVGPEMIALAVRDVPSRVSEIARRLHNLRVLCSTELLLEYTFEPHEPRIQTDATVYFAPDATAYLRVEDGELDWPSLGLRLADYLEVDLGDAMALLITADATIRQRFLGAHGVGEDDLQRARDGLLDESLVGFDDETGIDDVAPDFGEPGAADAQTADEDALSAVSSQDAPVAPTPAGTSPPGSADSVRSNVAHVAPGATGIPGATGDRRPTGVAPGPGDSDRHPGSSGLSAALKGTTRRSTTTWADEDSRFYSYVVARGSREARMAQRAEAEAMRIGAQGVDRVVEFESAAGRTATPQHHSNKGFDVISESADGRERRIIEVKATAATWPQRGIPVSSSQVEKNMESGDSFWLYVVEFAGDPEQTRVITLQNPAASIDYYVFDPGWQLLEAESKQE